MKSQTTRSKPTTLLLTALCLCIAAALVLPAVIIPHAKSSANQDPTEYLEYTLIDMGYTPEGDYTVDFTYSADLSPNGLEYVFELDSVPGFALMLKETDAAGNVYYDIMEIFFDAASPFATATGKKVYVHMLTYIDYTDGAYVDLESGTELTPEQVDIIAENGFLYGGGSDGTPAYERIDYSRREVNSYEIPYSVPTYWTDTYTKYCASYAGANVLSYYDIEYKYLIPDCETGYTETDGSWKYYKQPVAVTSLINELFNRMGSTNNGTTVNGFKNGFRDYVQSKGYSVTYRSVMVGGGLYFDGCCAYMEMGEPVVMFLSSFNVTMTILPSGTYDYIYKEYYNMNHVMVGCGYMVIDYYNSDSTTSFRYDQYVKVASGMSSNHGYMRLRDKIYVNEAICIDIFQ